MSLKANVSIILQIHSFKNLALPHKARYALVAQIYQGKPEKNPALPFSIIQTDTKYRKNVSRQSSIEDHLFKSKRFNLQFQDEQIELNDCCEFKMSIDGFPSLDDSQLYLEFILVENTYCYFRQDMEQEVEFKEAQRYKFKLENIQSGIIKYCQAEFNQAFISQFSFSLFLMVSDYRFYPFINSTKSESSRDKARQNVANINQLMNWSKKYIKNCQNPAQYFYKTYVKNLRYNSLLFRIELKDYLKNGKKKDVKLQIPKGQNRQLTQVSDKQFFDYVTNDQPQEMSEQLLKSDIYLIQLSNFYFFQELSNIIKKGDIELKEMRARFRAQRKDLYGQRVIRNIIFGKQVQIKQQTSKLASKLRKKKKINQLKLIDQHLFTKKENQHYAFFQVNLPYSLKTSQYQKGPYEQVLKQISELRRNQSKEKNPYDQRNMVVFLCHGFQASSYDMEMIRRQISKMLPTAIVYCSTYNERDTSTDINIMGVRLADEVKFIINRHFQDPQEAIINFVGHSMGGVISRACLQYLNEFSSQLGFFFSLSTPHLGYLNGVDSMIKAGMWFMRKMNETKSLDQLAMEDNQSFKQTFLYKLSQKGHLQNFQKIILLSSSEDSYVPWHSARICYHDGNNSRSKLERQMIDSILGDKIVHRIDIHFNIDSTKDVDSFIGRAAHINLLTQDSILKLVNEAVPDLFDIRQV